MKIQQVVFFDATPESATALRKYWSRKEARLERLLQFVPAYQRHVRVSSRPEGSDRRIRILLTLPNGTLVGTGKAPDWKVAVDLALDHLVAEIRKHKESRRRDRLQMRKRRSDVDMAAIGPELEAHARRIDKAAFMEQIKPMLRSIRDHAQRELIIAQLEGNISPGHVTVSDLLDEVIVRSWRLYKKDPSGHSLDRMLMSLLHDILDEYGSARGASESLYQEIPRTDPRYRVRIGWADDEEAVWGRPEALTLEELLPSDEESESSDKFREEEQKRWILAQLGTFPSRQRRAFALHLLEGWDEDAIGDLQGRPAAAVREDIRRIQRILRQRAAALRKVGETLGTSELPSYSGH